jgi:LacI family transcriptional regulator
MDQTAQRAGHSLLVSSSHHDARGVGFAVGAMRGRVDGLIVMAPELAASDVAEVLPHGLPTILLNGHGEGEALQSISVDNFGGARAMTKHLLSLGRRRIGFVCGAAHNADATARERGHHAALREAGESHDRTLDVRGDFTEASGWRAAQRLTSLDVPPSAIFAANDAMAVGVLSYLRAAGIDVPSQIAVVGFDDIPVARFLTPPLTTVRVGVAALGARATAVLLQALERSPPDGANARHEVLPTDLVVRGSCGAPPASQVSLAPLSLPSEDLFR